ncbi:MAG: outer membrane beta-barrel protein [Planctomycetota bacterium]
MKHRLVVLAVLLLGSVMAAEGDMADVLARLKALEEKNKAFEEKNKELEQKLKQAEARIGSGQALDKAVAAANQKMCEVVTAPDPKGRPLIIGGYFDISYEFNANRPDNQRNNLRSFDTDSNGFNVHLAELNFSRLPTEPGQAGFRVDLALGTDQRVFTPQDSTANPAERNSQFKDIGLKQAFLEYIVPAGNGITMDFGEFVTMHGAEVIEAADNINASRSFLFGMAIPFTHTGVRASYDVFTGNAKENGSGKWNVMGAAVNGWDNIQDQNNAKTFGLSSNWQATKWFNWTVNTMYGDEQYGDERARLAAATAPDTLIGDQGDYAGALNDPTAPGIDSQLGTYWRSHDQGGRFLVDTTFTMTPWAKWTFAVNGDYAYEGCVPNYNSPLANRRWYGVAGYTKYQFAKKWYIANRTEYFNDPQGVRSGRREALWETTLTFDWALSDPFHMRFEYRHDSSDVNAFSDDKGFGADPTNPFHADHQDTFMLQWLYKF